MNNPYLPALALQSGVLPSGTPVGPTIDRDQWKKVRGPLIGSSDVAAILGQSAFVQPWDVFDRIMLGDWDDAEGADIRRGIRQERCAREAFEERYALPTLPLPMVQHPNDARIVTDVDALILRPTEWPEVITSSPLWEPLLKQSGPGWHEIKVPRIARFYKYREEGLPNEYIIQGQHHGIVTGLTWGVFAFYTPEFDDLIAFPVVQDVEFSTWLFAATQRWYQKHIVGRLRPERPAPPPARWPKKIKGAADVREDDAWLEAAAALVTARGQADALARDVAKAEQAIVGLLGERDALVSGGGVKVHRYSTASQRRVDWKAYRAAVKLAQEEKDAEQLLTLDPDDDAFKYNTEPSDKVDIIVHAVAAPPTEGE